MMRIEEEIKQSKFQNSNQKAVVNLIYTAHWLEGEHQKLLSGFGITGQQFNILRILKGQHPNSISATEIKERMLDRNSDVSRLLSRLEKKNLIQRKSCESDKRATDIFISNEGVELLRQIAHEQNRLDHVLKLDEEDAQELSNLLDKARG
ncbi:MAG TPA: MarR family transcriptional regulator [Cyclobacteriaceae bacterium]|nr:MarR family transcriptional regulator [Cyclobacteriaceae bacterium]